MSLRRALLALVLVLGAAPAAAQDTGFSPAATEACLARVPGSVACVGVSAAGPAWTRCWMTMTGLQALLLDVGAELR